MKLLNIKQAALAGGALTVLAGASLGAVASAAATTASAGTDQQHLQAIITKGDQEINRRLSSLDGLTSKINAATKLTVSDKTTLANEVSSELTGLTALKTKLDAETTLSGAKADAQSIYTDYRVYALVTPKVWLVKTADDQQVVETKLTALAAKLQARITIAQNAGKNVMALQTQLNDLTAKTQAAQAISSAIETKVISLQPGDYNTDHTILSGDRDQLKTAHTDNQAAYTDAKAIVTALKQL